MFLPWPPFPGCFMCKKYLQTTGMCVRHLDRHLEGLGAKLERKSKDRPTRTPNVVFVVASHYQSLQIIVLLLQACRLEIYLFCEI